MKEETMRFNEGKTDWTYIDWDSIEPLAQVMEFGAKKYERDNWQLGGENTSINSLLASTFRHMIAIQKGEWFDGESGLPHVGHAMFGLMALEYHHGKK